MILCFLQNLWVREPERWKDWLDKNEDRRAMIIRHLLLDYGCLTGRRLKACFGEDLLEQMVIEEASREIAGNSKMICPPNPEHIKACLKKYKPKVVVTFGQVARDAVTPIWKQLSFAAAGDLLIYCPHPAARQKDTIAKLKAAAEQIRNQITTQCGG